MFQKLKGISRNPNEMLEKRKPNQKPEVGSVGYRWLDDDVCSSFQLKSCLECSDTGNASY